MIGALMLDIEGTTLTEIDLAVLASPQVGGVILFARNIQSPKQVRQLTDHIRQIRPEMLIAVDQEGGRVRRLKVEHGFSDIPAMGRLGELYQKDPQQALDLAESCGWLMATETLAVGIDFSFAPVLDVDNISDVIGDRGFSKQIQDIRPLATAFMKGMKRAGMATTGKHFPGHGSVKADSHFAAAIDERDFATIQAEDMQPFQQLAPMLDAIMPAHVIYPKVDANPAGFSPFWIQEILRKQLQFDGVLFSDDLSMQAACVAGDADARIVAALQAGCDMGLVCNDRESALLALQALENMPMPNQTRLEKMRGRIPQIEIGDQLDLGDEWRATVAKVQAFIQSLQA